MVALWIQNLDRTAPDGRDRYAVRINHEAPMAYFYHDRSKGAAQCLRDAADAIEQRNKED